MFIHLTISVFIPNINGTYTLGLLPGGHCKVPLSSSAQTAVGAKSTNSTPLKSKNEKNSVVATIGRHTSNEQLNERNWNTCTWPAPTNNCGHTVLILANVFREFCLKCLGILCYIIICINYYYYYILFFYFEWHPLSTIEFSTIKDYYYTSDKYLFKKVYFANTRWCVQGILLIVFRELMLYY